jgi:hypothetical protein
MGLLARLLGRTKESPPPLPAGPCAHRTLVPAWRSVADMGQDEKISGFTCDDCHQSFIASEGRALQGAGAAQTLK